MNTLGAEDFDRQQLEEYLSVARAQLEMHENGWYVARRIKTYAVFPDMPSLERPGTLEKLQNIIAVPSDDMQHSADAFALRSGYFAHGWRRHVNALEEMLCITR